MATDRPRFMISVDEETQHRIDAYKLSWHYRTQSQATEALILLGLKAAESLANPFSRQETDKS